MAKDMESYMVELTLPEVLGSDFILKIPQQKAKVNELMLKGWITSYILAQDRSRLWVVVQAESIESVYDTLKKMPLYSYMSAQIYETAVHRVVSRTMVHHISLN